MGTTSVTITQPAAVVPSTTFTNVTCNGSSNGTITVTATGGTGIITFSDGGTFQSSGNFTGLAPGTYTITAKDASGCTGTTSVTITKPAALVPSTTFNNVKFKGLLKGTHTVTATE